MRTGDEAEIAPTHGVTSRCHADIFRRVFLVESLGWCREKPLRCRCPGKCCSLVILQSRLAVNTRFCGGRVHQGANPFLSPRRVKYLSDTSSPPTLLTQQQL